MSQSKTKSKGRLSCRIDLDLLKWVHWYADQRRTTVTKLITDYIVHLKRDYEDRGRVDVDQL